MGFTFVDLFAGIGGFHAALEPLGGKCVFVSEIDEAARKIYLQNWKHNRPDNADMKIEGNIIPFTDPEVRVPRHDVLCAGFPCQPFSKSGKQRGMDEARGTLFWNIARIIQERKPSMILLENVRNIAGPRHRHEWNIIIRTLRELGYAVSSEPTVFSPHWLPPYMGGTPQVRERVFIAGAWVGTERAFELENLPPVIPKGPVFGWDPLDWNLEHDLPLQDESEFDVERYRLTPDEEHWLDVWNDFLDSVDCETLPGFPIWADELKNPMSPLTGLPKWKSDFLVKNNKFYLDHKSQIDDWKMRHHDLRDLPPSRRKLEWQAQDAERDLRKCVLHFRPSGIRAKRGTYVPALVAITQTSVVGDRGRRLTPREAARLQGLPDSFSFEGQSDAVTYKQLGNAVAVGAVRHVFANAVRSFRQELSPSLVETVERQAQVVVAPQSCAA
jgi:DNA (cytosine-5)-methyltransferase 1